jgi:5-methylcytosine-specific restriction enzyme A
MRDEIQRWVTTYPRSPGYQDGTYAGAAEAQIVRHDVPDAIRTAFPKLGGIKVKGSAGDRDWTHTPWVALLDQAVTTTVKEGYYVVYLLSHGCERLYLTIAQGCTELKEKSGTAAARAELLRRAARMRSRLGNAPKRLKPITISLGTESWRGKLYEPSVVVGALYDVTDLPSEDDLRQDLTEALLLYRQLRTSGGWSPDDEIMQEAREEHGSETLEQAKRYRQHRIVERQSGHSKQVKKRQGTKCKGCDRDLADIYGDVAKGVIDAHHLTPLSSLEDGQIARFDPVQDFAVLCPNFHRVIHRLPDPSDLRALRDLVIPYRG